MQHAPLCVDCDRLRGFFKRQIAALSSNEHGYCNLHTVRPPRVRILAFFVLHVSPSIGLRGFAQAKLARTEKILLEMRANTSAVIRDAGSKVREPGEAVPAQVRGTKSKRRARPSYILVNGERGEPDLPPYTYNRFARSGTPGNRRQPWFGGPPRSASFLLANN